MAETIPWRTRRKAKSREGPESRIRLLGSGVGAAGVATRVPEEATTEHDALSVRMQVRVWPSADTGTAYVYRFCAPV